MADSIAARANLAGIRQRSIVNTLLGEATRAALGEARLQELRSMLQEILAVAARHTDETAD